MNKRRTQTVYKRCLIFGAAVFLSVLIAFGLVLVRSSSVKKDRGQSAEMTAITLAASEAQTVSRSEPETEIREPAASFVVYPEKTSKSVKFSEDYDAQSAILMCCDSNEVVAYRDENKRVYPASLVKVMTLIVAVENNDDISRTVTVTDDMVFPMIEQEASRAGFEPGESFALEDALYGMILESGADAALAAAVSTAGSEKAFVELMNGKAEELGLKNTHFTNVVGLHHEENYTTAADMAVILEYAIRNDTCRRFLEKYEYNTAPTPQHPEGLRFTSTLFSRMYGDEMPGVKILGGKTGYTDEAGNCIETYAEINGKTYILVLCGGKTNWSNIYDTLSAYSVYCAGGKRYEPPEA